MDAPSVLCVDDEPEVLDSLRDVLRRSFRVVTARSGREALDALRQQPFAALVSDMRMPEMDGAMLLRLAREQSPQTVRLLLTGQADVETAVACVNDGEIFRFLTKPCPRAQLLAALRDAVHRNRLARVDPPCSDRERLTSPGRAVRPFKASMIGLATVAADGRFVRVNGPLCRLLDYRRAELLDLGLHDLLPGGSLGGTPHGRDGFEPRSPLQPFRAELRVVTGDGRERPLLLNLTADRSRGRGRRELTLEALDLSAEQRALAVGKLAGAAGKKLDSLLSEMGWKAQLAQSHTIGDGTVRASLEEIEETVGEASRVASQLLALGFACRGDGRAASAVGSASG